MTDLFIAPKKKKEIVKNDLPQKKNLPRKESLLHKNCRVGLLSTFSQNPKGVSFQNQKEGELIVLFLRSHLFVNLSWMIISITLALLPPIAFILLSIFKLDFLSLPKAINFTAVFVLLYYLLVFSYVFISFMHWFYNVFIVTTERVVDIDYSDIVVHNIAATNLSYIQDVNYTQSGFIPTYFNYGNLFVQTAGTEMNFEAYSIPTPTKAINIILDLIGKNRKK